MQAPEGFWDMYCEIHSFLPASLLSGADAGTIQREFYYLCTDIFDQLAGSGAGLQELLAVTQSRDRLERHSPGAN
jgi:hypothetical protein